MKKYLSLLLAVVMVLSLLAGCGSKEKSEPTAAPAVGNEPAATEANVVTNADRKTVSIRFAQFGNSVDDVDGMANDPIKAAIEAAVNVELEYDTGVDGFDDRMQTELYTGGAAELFPTWGETDKITKWAEEDLVWNIAEIINAEPERYPTLYAMINTPEYKAYNTLYTGDAEAAYAIYSVAAFADPSFNGAPIYNQAILDEINGGKVPTTVEEFITFVKDCGEAGYVGWWPRNNKLTNWGVIDAMMARPQGTSLLAPNGDAWAGFISNGKIGTDEEYWTLATTSEASKEVVKQLADMYQSGGLDSGLGVKGDFDDAYSDFAAGKLASYDNGFGYPGQFGSFLANPWKSAHEDGTMADLAQGVALTSNGSYGSTYTTGTWIGAHYFIPTTCDYPDRVLDLVEYLASAAGQDLLHNTTNYVYNTEVGSDEWNSTNSAYGYQDGRCKYVWFSYLFSGTEYQVDFTNNDWWTAVSKPIDNSNNWATEENAAAYDYAKGVISTFVDDVVYYLPAYYNMISLPGEAADIRTKLADITNQYLTQFLGGQLDIEAGWADYVAEYEAAGAAELEQMVNDAIAAARANG